MKILKKWSKPEIKKISVTKITLSGSSGMAEEGNLGQSFKKK